MDRIENLLKTLTLVSSNSTDYLAEIPNHVWRLIAEFGVGLF